ncbi:diacylglycerol O-acyltransferase 2 [Physcomitrium patens]|uniref:Acyltransferase n=1 Tax=Physcomitrium patens TaxID=3218 RepID=A0A2K1IY18_PHYPA|nr:diacylglycerol O-acyltransferase 2-like [Physcomitrium patens]XP_024403326.1 diacylglycerol O-acyltransferase 2-like [Physcomitrium patens]PNR34173.1 hypothetical protein PHYPA_023990 [Physcomitrium patens]|eukprot:XP_024403325.1 diacylglycerol O-acyltransferase 2-like [Physcomitrella patens]
MGSLDNTSRIARQELEVAHKTVNDDRSKSGVTSNQGDGGSVPQFHYFCKPHSTTVGTVLVLIFYHMLPFTAIPHILLFMYLPYYLQQRCSYAGLTIYVGFLLSLLVVPPYYSKTVRRKVRVLYEALAVHLPSARFIIVPKEPLPQDKGYIFAIHPHGRMFYSNALFSQLHEIWRAPLKLTHGDLFQTAAGGFFYAPFARNWFYMIGIMPASKENIVDKLRNKDHVTIAVGGVREVCLGTQVDADVLYIKRRRGFLQIAMDEGAGVVPVYAFNENQLFKHDPRFLLDFWQWVNNYVKIGVPFMRGYFNLPMPYSKELLLVFGEPLFSKEDESIEDFHARYVESLTQLFERYVRFSPDPKHKLILK